jgi:dienelactone hydrolase
LLFITGNDHLVPLESMRAYDAAARRTGVDVQTVIVPYAEHGFDAAGIGNMLVRQATLRFLAAHVSPNTGR